MSDFGGKANVLLNNIPIAEFFLEKHIHKIQPPFSITIVDVFALSKEEASYLSRMVWYIKTPPPILISEINCPLVARAKAEPAKDNREV